MAVSGLAVIAGGEVPSGQRWILRAGGTGEEFQTFLETIHPDGSRDEGGMAGRPLSPGAVMNVYAGGTDTGLRRFVVRADPRVAQVRIQFAGGERLDLAPVATVPDPPLVFFATLLPSTSVMASVTAIGTAGQTLEPLDLTRHEQAWQRFKRRAAGG